MAVILQGMIIRKRKRNMCISYMKFQDDISFWNITVAKFQCPKFTKRAITKKIYDFFLQFFTKYSIYHLSADTNFKILALILFEILHLQNFIPCFSKGRNFTRGDNWGKYASAIFL